MLILINQWRQTSPVYYIFGVGQKTTSDMALVDWSVWRQCTLLNPHFFTFLAQIMHSYVHNEQNKLLQTFTGTNVR